MAETDETLFSRAFALQQGRGFAAAAEIYLDIAQRRATSNLARNLAICLESLGRYDQAEAWLGDALAGRPDDPTLLHLLGSVHARQGRVEVAERDFRQALSLAPDQAETTLALAGLLLSVGRWAEGWPLMEARVAIHSGAVPPVGLGYPEWMGEPLAGRDVLVAVEQGLGDQLQMARFASVLKARGAGRVTLACRPPLKALFEAAPGVDAAIAVAPGQVADAPRHDLWTRYFSLPARLGITLESLPREPYLVAPQDRRARWRGHGGVGLAWEASATGFNGTNKTLPPEVARAILDQGAVSLRPQDTGAADFADTAAIIEQLDLVISIDSSVAHLAGAMGKPCWTLLPALGLDWRWMRERSDSPWYPSMRLFRQDTPGDWWAVIAQVLTALNARS